MFCANIIPDLIKDTPVGISIYAVTQEQCHYHEGFLEIIYCFKGNAAIHCAHEDIALVEGDIISCDPTDIHALQSSEENLFVSFYFDLKNPIFNVPGLEYMFFVCERYVLNQEKQNEMQNLKHLLLTLLYFYCFPHPRISHTETFNNLAKRIMDLMLDQFHFFDYTIDNNHYSSDAKKRFERLHIYICQHYSEKLTMGMLSQQEHLTANYLAHFFKKTSFLGYSNYLNYVRIYYSEKLLLTTNKNISEISYESGFSDPKFYYRYFKKWYGYTPLQHRKYFQENRLKAEANHVYRSDEIVSLLEHYIAYYFATLHIPEFWNVPYIPYRNVPIK